MEILFFVLYVFIYVGAMKWLGGKKYLLFNRIREMLKGGKNA